MAKYVIKKCPCGHRACIRYHLVGIGHFDQGTGFSLGEAEKIVDALNENEKLRALLQDLVDHHTRWGGDEWGEGVDARLELDRRLREAGIK